MNAMLRRRTAALLLLSSLTLAVPPLPAEDVAAEYQLKAAFLVNFALYVAWPDVTSVDATAPFVFGVLGDDPFGHWLDDAAAGRSVQGRRAAVRRYAHVEEAIRADVLYVGLSEPAARMRALAVLSQAPVLTVGETDDFLAAGGIIRLRTEARRVRFDVNLDAARRAGLQPSSQLLKLARYVQGGPDAR